MNRPARFALRATPALLVLAMLAGGCAQLAQKKPAAATPDWMAGAPQPAPAPTAGCPHIPAIPAGQKPPKPPASDFPQTLQPGHWEWSELNYRWYPPRWVIVVAGGHPVWRPGGWAANNGACVWRPGHWFIPPVPQGL